jgi:Family of unknown function (DUF6518)
VYAALIGRHSRSGLDRAGSAAGQGLVLEPPHALPSSPVPGPRKLAVVFLAALGFGVSVAVIKGQDAGWQQTFGNLSAPWMLVPFLAGTACERASSATLVGLGATFAAFLGFYTAEAVVLDLGAHPWYTDLQLALGSGHVYWKLGVLSGPLFGLLGWVWASRRWLIAPLVLGLAFVTEPLIIWSLGHAQIWGDGLKDVWIYAGEVILGVAAAGFLIANRGDAQRR